MKTYSMQAKAAPPLPPTGMDPGGSTPPPSPEELQAHEWAGDLYEQGDQSDPAQAFARFQGVDGETAWLDRADDGTLTGWVQDADGSIYRYSDDAAWAIDVDQAGMRRSDVPDAGDSDAGDEAVDPADGEGESDDGAGDALAPIQDPADAGDPMADGDVDPAELTDAVDEEFAVGGADLPEEGEPVDADGVDPEDEDEDDGLPPGLQTKSWSAADGGTFTIRPRGGTL